MSPFVLKGLRLLPWLQMARRRRPDAVGYMLDCDSCKKKQSVANRQLMGCGYELPPADNLLPYVQPWDHEGRVRHADEVDENKRVRLPICPGYACSRPEVTEAAWAHSYWEKGELTQYCDGKQASPQLREAIQVLAIEQARAQSWEVDNPKKEGS